MSWRRATFKDQDVWVEVDAAGVPRRADGRVPIRYSDAPGARIYRAGASRVDPRADAPAEDLPPGVDADAPAEPKPARGSGFGKAGSRTPEQARAAAAHANGRIAALPEGTVVCFTDGACRGNPGPAGSGVVVTLPDGRTAEASKALGRSTNNVAELTAIEVALDLLDAAEVPPETPTVVFTDSSYAEGVLRKGWKAKANAELVQALRRRLRARPALRLEWVAGHAGVGGNERADVLANRGVAGVTEVTQFTAERPAG